LDAEVAGHKPRKRTLGLPKPPPLTFHVAIAKPQTPTVDKTTTAQAIGWVSEMGTRKFKSNYLLAPRTC
jgi:hypothetical protein